MYLSANIQGSVHALPPAFSVLRQIKPVSSKKETKHFILEPSEFSTASTDNIPPKVFDRQFPQCLVVVTRIARRAQFPEVADDSGKNGHTPSFCD